MKKTSVLIMAVVMSLIGVAQNTNFEKEMLKRTKQIEQKDNKVDLLDLSKEFETLSKANPKRIEAKYYTALCLIFNAYEIKEASEKDKQLLKAENILSSAIEQDKENSELYILKAMCYQILIDVDPQTRGYVYSQKAEKELARAVALDSNNPRYYFLKGQNIFYTPEQYGGGKSKAKPYFEKASKLFKKSKRENKLDPIWGSKTNALQLKACRK